MGNLKVSTRLGLGFGAVLLLLALVALIGWFNMYRLNQDIDPDRRRPLSQDRRGQWHHR
ncbi:MCP four helix bundle domain-containing protein [Thermochromatium tepidum]|uniref:MCP four helix bundle domain-containing protein n=1 Tax=Thermochromatium tepidum TaxID=1050 RepID=UPI0031B5CCBE